MRIVWHFNVSPNSKLILYFNTFESLDPSRSAINARIMTLNLALKASSISPIPPISDLPIYKNEKDENIYFNTLVTPGLGAAGHIRRFSKRLIKEDFPTFGYPTIPARTCSMIM